MGRPFRTKTHSSIPHVRAPEKGRVTAGIISGMMSINLHTVRRIICKHIDAALARTSRRATREVISDLIRQNHNSGTGFSNSDLKLHEVAGPIGECCRPARGVRKVLVRTALGIAVSRRPISDFVNEVSRLHAAGVDVGPVGHHRNFAATCLNEASTLIDEMMHDETCGIHAMVPSLGISSDIEIASDAVSVLKSKSNPLGLHSMFLTGVVYTMPHGSTRPVLVGARGHGSSATGKANVTLLRGALDRI